MGFKLSKSQSSADHNGKLERFSVASGHATLLAPGDLIKLTGTSDAEGVASVDAATAGAAFTGVVAGFEPLITGENLSETGLPAGTAGFALCHTDPNLEFDVIVDAALAVTDVGLNADADPVAATKAGGLSISNMVLDQSTKLSTATLQWKIVGLIPNSAGVTDGLNAKVRINNSTYRAGTVGV